MAKETPGINPAVVLEVAPAAAVGELGVVVGACAEEVDARVGDGTAVLVGVDSCAAPLDEPAVVGVVEERLVGEAVGAGAVVGRVDRFGLAPGRVVGEFAGVLVADVVL